MLPKLKNKKSHYFIAKTRPKPTTKIGRLWEKLASQKLWLITIVSLLLLTTLIFGFYRPKKDKAVASESGMISAALKQKTEQSLELNSSIELTLTLQNSSSLESLKNLQLTLTNTVNAVKWSSIQNLNSASPALNFSDKVVVLPNLAANERVEYEIKGTLQNTQIPILAIIGKLNYTNSQGLQETQTNRVLNYLKETSNQSTQLELKTSKDSYDPGQEIILAVNLQNSITNGKTNQSSDSSDNTSDQTEGKIFITNQKTLSQVAVIDCRLQNASCQVSVELPSGNYSAVFVDQKDNYSTLKDFLVTGQTDQLVPNPQATMTLPFGSKSLNGQVAVLISKILPSNQELKVGWECVLVISKDGQIVSQIKTPISQDKTCRIVLDNLETSGSYEVALAGTNLRQNFVFEKTDKAFDFQNSTQKNKNLQLISGSLKSLGLEEIVISSSSTLPNSQGQNSSEIALSSQTSSFSANVDQTDIGNVNNTDIKSLSSRSSSAQNANTDIVSNQDSSQNSQATSSSVLAESSSANQSLAVNQAQTSLFIFHVNSGKLKEIISFDNQPLVIKNDQFNFTLSADNFSDSGQYKIWTQTKQASGQNIYSQIFNLNFGDQKVGLVKEGIVVDYQTLVAGQEITFKIKNLTDVSGNIVNNGSCQANLYLTGQANPVAKKGQLQSGQCQVTFAKDEVKVAGPALITFAQGDNPINQSRHLEIKPSDTITLGNLRPEYQPMRKDFSNALFLGPATDSFGNLISLDNLSLQIINKAKISNPNTDISPSQNSSSSSSLDQKTKLDPQDPRSLVTQNSTTGQVGQINQVSIKNGFGKVEIPASLLTLDSLTFRLVDQNQRELSSGSFDLIERSDKLIIPAFPKVLKTEDNLQVSLAGLTLKDTQITDYQCGLTWISNNLENLKTEVGFDKNDQKCQFNWDLQATRNHPQALIELAVGPEKFTQIVNLEATVAGNLFITAPQTHVNNQGELVLNLLTSPIVDKYGLALTQSQINWQYNKQKATTNTTKGLGKLEITASGLVDEDYKLVQNKKALDLDIDVKAGTTSISKTNNLNVLLGDFALTKDTQQASVQKTSNVLAAEVTQVLRFQSQSCEVIMLGAKATQKLATHWQNGTCLVQVKPGPGHYTLIFEKDGFVSGQFEFSTGPEAEVITSSCQNNSQTGCLIQVQGATSPVTATILDGDKTYKFVSDELENAVLIKQKDLKSDQKYLVQISFENQNKQQVIWQELILGQLLTTK